MMKYKLLVIDDEPLIRLSLESGLSDLGYQVHCTGDLHEGLALAARLQPDAVLLDNRVGSERGIDHITDFKRLDEDMILILMTAYGEAVDFYEGEIPVFWPCGVTPQAAVENAKPPIAITHAPGHMFITDIVNAELNDYLEAKKHQ